jgi:hypothetical protein
LRDGARKKGQIGYVRAIDVKNGQDVEAGQLLIELDPTLAGANAEQAARVFWEPRSMPRAMQRCSAIQWPLLAVWPE